MHIFLTHTPNEIASIFSEEAVEQLKSFGTVSLNPLDRHLTSAELLRYAEDADIIVSEWETGMDAFFIQNAKRLKAFIRSGVEIRNVDFAEADRKRIMIVNTPGHYVNPVVELTIGFMVALNRKIVDYTVSLKNGVKPPVIIVHELCGKTLSIIGLGAIGRRLAVVAKALGMRVLGVDPYVREIPEGVDGLVEMPEALREGDYISLHAVWTSETESLISVKELSLMKPSAFLINTSRGALVDENALYEALASGKLAGAALDVFSNEPDIAGNPLLSLPNVIATPHIGGYSRETMKRQSFAVVEAVKEIASGKIPRNTLNRHIFDSTKEVR